MALRKQRCRVGLRVTENAVVSLLQGITLWKTSNFYHYTSTDGNLLCAYSTMGFGARISASTYT